MLRQMSAAVVLLVIVATTPVYSQETRQRPPEFVSTEISAERLVTFRLLAPNATKVRLSSSDLPSINGPGLEMNKADNGIWEITTNAVPAGAYRYSFNLDGLNVVDPRNPVTSESNSNSSSLVIVPGSDISDLKDVPHGAVAQVAYFSKSLNRSRRMHVYTPPGYEKSSRQFPVLYLLHGATDCDASWSTIGQAGQILDNLIAAGKARPMIVVMPMGHTGPFTFGASNNFEKQMEEFIGDFQKSIRPLVEDRYRVSTERRHRAIAGLSMGGIQSLNIAITDLGDYAYLGVFSSGIFGRPRAGGDNREAVTAWETKNKASLENAELKKGLRLVWFATGKTDFLLPASRSTVEALKSNGFDVTFKETEGGHTWLNWREYLSEFAPLLFSDDT